MVHAVGVANEEGVLGYNAGCITHSVAVEHAKMSQPEYGLDKTGTQYTVTLAA